MSLIDFPNVPPLTGVPDLRRSGFGIASQSGLLGKLQGLDYFGLLDGLLNPVWMIIDENGKPIITPDSVVAFEYKGESRLAGYPMEKGSFSTYNKVQMPFDARMRVTCGGNGKMDRSAFLATLEYLKASLDLCTIVTPDLSYQSVNLEDFDYRRTATNGVTLITADLMFKEVRETASVVFGPAAQPSGADTASTGTVSPANPAPAVTGAYSSQARIDQLKAAFPNATFTTTPPGGL
ncbi:hypothetical protein HX776_24440 [Pseudomonas agarici]|uniref:phage baseplate protein n=1 Tax=Pseudomonas agarici TaxID=46677 RepID=UPI000304A882|nr:hypothetical protein [Pseudomonas agarici]NWC11940.1 hypothetical protein [Pseudomonas agarici]SEL85690.1 hypothetical protein SAMN05216604_14027 [Pseudomonas agarici]